MILALDVGNTQIHGGVFADDELLVQFRKTSSAKSSSDEYGLFLKSVLRENDVDPKTIRHISICTVVPDLLHSLKGCCQKYFNISPFILQAGVKTGLKIKYRNPQEVGADRIANSLACVSMFPHKNLVIADFGTATTLCVVNKEKEYLGGAILPGVRISMEALESKTAKLPSVEIVQPETIVGRSTVESIQSGLYFGQFHMVKGMIEQIIKEENWTGADQPLIIATGGFSRLYESQNFFHTIVPDLALRGLCMALQMNQ